MTDPVASHRVARSLVIIAVTLATFATAAAQPRLRERADVVVLDAGRFLDAAGVPK